MPTKPEETTPHPPARYVSSVDQHPPGFHEKRRRILNGAAQVFERRGFAAGTTREIAAEVGLSQPAIYHYVGAKDDLLSEIARQVAHDMTDALERGLASDDDPAAQLRAVIHHFVAAVIHNQSEFAVFWKELHNIPVEVRASVLADERQFMERFDALVKTLQQLGTLPANAPSSAVTEAIVGMVCWTYQWYRPGRSPDPDEVAATFCKLIGLRCTDDGSVTAQVTRPHA